MRNDEVVQPADVLNGHIGVNRRLAIGREEHAAMGMPPAEHIHVERSLDIRSRSRGIYQHAVGMRADDLQTAGAQKPDYRLVVVLGWPEPVSELRGRQKLPVAPAGWIVERPT